MKRVGVFGGSFDPPHIGHITNITAVLNSQLVEEVWLAPTGQHRFKKTAAAAAHRQRMVEILLTTVFASTTAVSMTTVELERPSVPATTIDLITRLRTAHRDGDFAVVIGSDLIEQIPSWERGDELLATTRFLIVPRLGMSIPEKLPPTMQVVPTECRTDVSSSTIRAMIAQGRRLEGLIPPEVLQYIHRHGLYKGRGDE